jgi:4-amino-4-deoxy-L-arabinose transferase-like glycosyltransferase
MFFVLAERHPNRRRRYLILSYVATGLGVLTKGPVAVVLPALVCVIWLAMEGRLRDVARLMIVPGAAIVLGIVTPWYAAIYAQHGWGYIQQFFIGENLARYANPITTERSLWFYLPAVFADMLLPWAPLLVVPIIGAWRRRPRSTDPGDAIRRLLWTWIVVIVLVFTFSASKEDLYVFPVIPAAAVLIADTLMATGFGARHRGVATVMVVVALLCAAMGAAVFMIFRTGYYALQGAGSVAVVLTTCGLLVLVLVLRRRHAAAVFAMAAGFVVFNYLFVAKVLPDAERLKPVPSLAREVVARAGSEARLGFFNMVLPSFVYYTGRPVAEISGLDDAVRFFGDHADAWVMTGEREWTLLQDRMPGLCVAARRPLFEARGSDILRDRPPVDVLIVTNRCQGTAPVSANFHPPRPVGDRPVP